MNLPFIFIVISGISIFSLGKHEEEKNSIQQKETYSFGSLQKVW